MTKKTKLVLNRKREHTMRRHSLYHKFSPANTSRYCVRSVYSTNVGIIVEKLCSKN